MNIQMQCCGLIIMLFLLYFFLRQKTVGLYTEKMFLMVLGVTILCVCLDILSVIVIVNHDYVSETFLKIVCKTYITSLVWVGYFALLYACMDVNKRKRYRSIIRVSAVGVVLASVLIYALPIQYYVNGRTVYTYGPSVLTTYVFAVLFVAVTLFLVLTNGVGMNPKRRNAVRIWMFVWLFAAVIQFMFNQLLLVGFASSLGMVILFFELENPEANLDRVTGAYNAHALFEFMKQEYEKERQFSALLISMERYRNRNIRIGQKELLIQEIVHYLESIPQAKVFKNVERELIILFPDEESLYQAFPKVQKRFEKDWADKETGKRVRIEPFYLLMPDSSIADSAEEVFHFFKYFKVQDGAQQEKGIVVLDKDMVSKKREKEEIEEMIVDAMKEDRIEVFFQPIYATKEKRFVSAEALVRIRDRDGKIIPPGRFIGVAEENGLISKLGEIVFDKTCRFIKNNNVQQYGIKYIEVNLSVVQCEEQNLADLYIKTIDKYGLDPSCINLEITESASIQTKKTLVKNMQILIEYGIRFSLDDFGNGQSNLNYIVDMPVSIVKFDRDMSQAYFANQKAKFVMEAAMRMIHDMKLEIVSEGIETKEQMEAIVSLGIDYIQGYYFSKPLPANEFLEFIKKKNVFA